MPQTCSAMLRSMGSHEFLERKQRLEDGDSEVRLELKKGDTHTLLDEESWSYLRLWCCCKKTAERSLPKASSPMLLNTSILTSIFDEGSHLSRRSRISRISIPPNDGSDPKPLFLILFGSLALAMDASMQRRSSGSQWTPAAKSSAAHWERACAW